MERSTNQEALDRIVAGIAGKKHVYGAVFRVSSGDGGGDIVSAAGDITEDSRYYVASINKFIISAVVLRLCSGGRLGLHDRLSRYLTGEEAKGLHTCKGRDYSGEIEIIHLLSLTSGLPCYLADRQAGGKKAMAELEAGMDQPWPLDKVIREVKRMEAHFPPGKEGKARYSDTNHHLLCRVIERVTEKPVKAVLDGLFSELGMTETFVCPDADGREFIPIRRKAGTLRLPLFLASTRCDVVSTAKDQMAFLKAFFGGRFFPKERLKELEKWNSIFFPFQYGIGIERFHMPRILSPLRPVPDMIGHCGSTGAVAFYAPERDLYITGTVNQQAGPAAAFRAMIKILADLPRGFPHLERNGEIPIG